MSDATASEAVATTAPATAVDAPATATTAPAPAATTSLLTDETETTTTDESTETVTPKAGDENTEEKKPEEEVKGAPESYAEFTLPEGVQMEATMLDQFKTIAKEANLPQETAQKLVDLHAGMAGRVVEQLRTSVDASAREWETTARADAEIGGAKFNEHLGVAKKALDTFGTPELKTLLKESRLGSHPEVIRLLARAGKAISQDGFVPGRAAAAKKSDADVFYGSTTPSK